MADIYTDLHFRCYREHVDLSLAPVQLVLCPENDDSVFVTVRGVDFFQPR